MIKCTAILAICEWARRVQAQDPPSPPPSPPPPSPPQWSSATFTTIDTTAYGVTAGDKYNNAVAVGTHVFFEPDDEDNVEGVDEVSCPSHRLGPIIQKFGGARWRQRARCA